MTDCGPPTPTDSDRIAQAVTQVLARDGAEWVRPNLLQPAADILAHYGEGIRNRACVIDDAHGGELFLIPDYTVPVCRRHLAAGGGAGRYVYAGPVFRLPLPGQGEAPIEEAQAGIEDFGGEAIDAAESEILRLVLDAVAAAGVTASEIVVGDAGLVDMILASFPMADHQRRRLRRRAASPERLRTLLDRFTDTETKPASPERQALLDRFAPAGPDGGPATCPEEQVGARLQELGVAAIGRRTRREIGERLVALESERRAPVIRPIHADWIQSLLTLRAPFTEAIDMLVEARTLMALDGLTEAIETVERRREAFRTAGIDPAGLQLEVGLGHDLGYYDGLVFTVMAETGGKPVQVAGGGRYDSLPRALGATLTAVGAAVWTERLARARQSASAMAA